MKYDCTKTLDYVHEERRLCDSKIKKKDGLRIHDCKDCELNNHPCNLASGKVTQAEIDIVQKWSDKHREKGKEDALIKKVIEVDKLFGKDIEVDELFGRFIVAFEFMDADWRRCVLQFLTVMNDQLSEEKDE